MPWLSASFKEGTKKGGRGKGAAYHSEKVKCSHLVGLLLCLEQEHAPPRGAEDGAAVVEAVPHEAQVRALGLGGLSKAGKKKKYERRGKKKT